MHIAIATETVKSVRVLISRDDILEFLRGKGVMAENATEIMVGITTPGSGEWCHDSDAVKGVIVTWNEKTSV